MRERGGVRAKLIEKEEIRDLISKEKGIENEEREVVVKKKKKKRGKDERIVFINLSTPSHTQKHNLFLCKQGYFQII